MSTRRAAVHVPVPSTIYEVAVWTSFGMFYASFLSLAGCIAFSWGFTKGLALTVIAMGCFAGSRLAQELHLANRMPPDSAIPVPDAGQDLFDK